MHRDAIRTPRLPLPEPLRGADPGSFAEHTVARRMPDIARRVLDENELDAGARARMQTLIDELPHRPVGALDDPGAPDAEAWHVHVAAAQGKSWLEVPWFFAETYFYRRIVAAVGYFGGNDGIGLDPFAYQKRRGLEVSAQQIETAFSELDHALEAGWSPEEFARILKADLWGNQADLSLWPADDQNHPSHEAEDADAHLLIDDAERTADLLDARGGGVRVDVLVDNAGFELIGDLVLADYLLTTEAARTVALHLKLHPTFVSDATTADVRATLDTLARSTPHASSAAERLQKHLERGGLVLRTHLFWTSPLPGWDLPPDVREELSASDLVVSKGDANYRRLLGDLKWPLDADFPDIAAYFPAPLVALRTYKSEVGCGLTPDRISSLNRQDPDWMTNGKWGVIQASWTR